MSTVKATWVMVTPRMLVRACGKRHLGFGHLKRDLGTFLLGFQRPFCFRLQQAAGVPKIWVLSSNGWMNLPKAELSC